jgi:integrase
MANDDGGVPLFKRDKKGKRVPEGEESRTPGRWYADFRSYRDVLRDDEASIQSLKTANEAEARKQAGEREQYYKAKRLGLDVSGMRQAEEFGEFADYVIDRKRRSRRFVSAYLDNMQKQLPNGRGGTLSDKTIRDHLNSVSNLFKYARARGTVPGGYNPVGDMVDKPTPEKYRPSWFEVYEGAALLESARTYEPPPDKHGLPFMYPLLATYLLTGGRDAEVKGLMVEEVVRYDQPVVIDGQTIRCGTLLVRPNKFRRLKTNAADRRVPLWPQLDEILGVYLSGPYAPDPDGLLFPSPRTGRMTHDIRKALDAIGKRVGFPAGEVRAHGLRHTYCATRIQTTDHGAPVSLYTVMEEMGHTSLDLIKQRYGHLQDNPHRSPVVEFRVEQWQPKLKDRLKLISVA